MLKKNNLSTFLTVMLITVINKFAVKSRKVAYRDNKCLPP